MQPIIMVVDDDSNILNNMVELLQIGYPEAVIHTAHNGERALELLNQLEALPHVILCDISMPVMDGIILFQHLLKNYRWRLIPFVFVTARAEREDIAFGRKLGVSEYITKPYDSDEFLAVVKTRIERQKAIAEYYNSVINTLKKDILTILSHELRTPLTQIVGYADLIDMVAEDVSTEDLMLFLGQISNGAKRLRRLIENFMLLMEIDSGNTKALYDIQRQPIQDVGLIFQAVSKLLHDVMENNRPLPQIEKVSTPVFFAHPDLLAKALAELLDNAYKFAENQPPKIGVKSHDKTIEFYVHDMGRGIAPEELTKIWEIFYQINRPLHEDQGAGSGLPIVKGITRIHSGHVTVASTLGQGSTFSIFIPCE